jgi:hypothetical protein
VSKRNFVIPVAVLIAASIVGGAGVALASSHSAPSSAARRVSHAVRTTNHNRTALAGSSHSSSGGACRLGYYTNHSFTTPPSNPNYLTVASVTVTKPCAGAVIGNFTTQVDTAAVTFPFLLAEMRATCVGTGGYTTHCTVGAEVNASPAMTTLSETPETGTRSFVAAWHGLQKGKWDFEVDLTGDGRSFVENRAFTVEAYTGG